MTLTIDRAYFSSIGRSITEDTIFAIGFFLPLLLFFVNDYYLKRKQYKWHYDPCPRESPVN